MRFLHALVFHMLKPAGLYECSNCPPSIYGGAGLCLAGLKLLQARGASKESLVPSNKIVTAIGGSEISWLG